MCNMNLKNIMLGEKPRLQNHVTAETKDYQVSSGLVEDGSKRRGWGLSAQRDKGTCWSAGMSAF